VVHQNADRAIICFAIAGYIIGNRPRNYLLVSVACIVGAFVQAVMEAATFLVFGEEALNVAILSAFGNTATHGIALGLIPTLILIPLLYGRIERFFGYAPAEDRRGGGGGPRAGGEVRERERERA